MNYIGSTESKDIGCSDIEEQKSWRVILTTASIIDSSYRKGRITVK